MAITPNVNSRSAKTITLPQQVWFARVHDGIMLGKAKNRFSEVPGLFVAWRMKAISYALGGHPEGAAEAARRLLELDPSARVSILAPPLRRREDRERYREGLIRAGLSE
jgi:hypothetical protein